MKNIMTQKLLKSYPKYPLQTKKTMHHQENYLAEKQVMNEYENLAFKPASSLATECCPLT